ncbi:hypothetical protein [Agrilactobacillus composti]|nr:hypothetical protein [Agrilactobacillus composti]
MLGVETKVFQELKHFGLAITDVLAWQHWEVVLGLGSNSWIKR